MTELAQRGKAALRGMERIQQLCEEFPQIPRILLLKMDMFREGIRPSAGSRLAGRWALPFAPWYFDYTYQDAQRKEEMTSQGYFLTPITAHFPDGSRFEPLWDSGSPYEIRYEDYGHYRLYRDEDLVDELFFTPRPLWYDRKTSSGKPMPTVIQQRDTFQLMLVPLTTCGYGKDACLYCNINSSIATKRNWGLEVAMTKTEQEIYETLMAALPEQKQLLRIVVSGGVMLDPHQEAEAYARCMRAAKRAMKDTGVEAPMNVLCQAMEEEDQVMLKEEGAARFGHDLEVWDPRLFEIICPGKAKHVGRQKWIDAILSARDIMGEPGRAYTLFNNGVGLMHPDGYKTEDEDFEQYMEGMEWMMARGIDTFGVHMRPQPGTMFEGMEPPRTEYFLRCDLAWYELDRKYNIPHLVTGTLPGVGAGLDIRSGLSYLGLKGEARPPEKAGC